MVNSQEPQKGIIIFIKNPELGKVKTRLAKGVGDHKALEIYKKLLAFTKQVALSIDAQRFLFYSKEIADDNWSQEDFQKETQSNGDLGDRMKTAFSISLKKADHVLIIGSDCPQLSADIVNQAFEQLLHNDLVIGPTLDGGYYLLGMNKCHDFLFDQMEWSVSSVFSETISRAHEHGLTTFELATLSDIDHKEDWDKYGWE